MGARIGTNSKIGIGGRSVDYYLEELAETQRDYYTGRGEAAGEWAGSLAETLGLSGQLTPEQFTSVMEGVHPLTGEPLKPYVNLKNQGLDITFDLPKSFSAFYALADEHGRAVMHQAVREALDAYAIPYLEDYACIARLGAQGKDRVPGTGFLVSTFTHRQSREGDPQLHVHAIFANVVHTEDGRAAAPDMHMLYAHHNAAGALFEAGVRHVLSRELGFSFEERNGHIEIAGIPAELCHLWSTRRAQIQALADQWGMETPRAMQAAAYATRKGKDKDVDERGLHVGWRDQAAEWDRHRGGWWRPFGDFDDLGETLAEQADTTERLTDAEIIDRLTGPHGLTEKASSFALRDIALGAAKLLHADDATPQRVTGIVKQVLGDDRVLDLVSPGRATSGELMQLRDAQGHVTKAIRQHERRYTTVELREAEQEVLDRTARRHGGDTAIVPAEIVERVLARHPQLDNDQQAAVRAMCTSGNGVDVVIGRAGTGKSATMNAAREAFEEAGIRVIGVAPTATAAHLLGRSAQLGQSSTVHRLLDQLEHNAKVRLASGSVVILDEAAMADTRTLLRLQRQVDVAGAKLVPAGDYRQIPSVDVGGLLPHIAQIAGASELTHNYRFDRIEMRDAAEQIRDGATGEGIAGLRRLGMVHEHDTHESTLVAMVARWAELRGAGKDVRMYADLNATCHELNRRAQGILREQGIVGAGRLFTDRQTGRTVVIGQGDQVILNRNHYDPSQPDGGDAVLRNGMRGEAIEVTRKGIRVQLDPEHVGDGEPSIVWLDRRYTAAEVTLGYASTPDKGQGATHDHSLYAASDRSSLERGYVALSRGRASNELFATYGQPWQDALETTRAHEPAIGQHPIAREQGVEAERPIQRQRDRWLAERVLALEAERQARQQGREDAGRQRDNGRGRGMAM